MVDRTAHVNCPAPWLGKKIFLVVVDSLKLCGGSDVLLGCGLENSAPVCLAHLSLLLQTSSSSRKRGTEQKMKCREG